MPVTKQDRLRAIEIFNRFGGAHWRKEDAERAAETGEEDEYQDELWLSLGQLAEAFARAREEDPAQAPESRPVASREELRGELSGHERTMLDFARESCAVFRVYAGPRPQTADQDISPECIELVEARPVSAKNEGRGFSINFGTVVPKASGWPSFARAYDAAGMTVMDTGAVFCDFQTPALPLRKRLVIGDNFPGYLHGEELRAGEAVETAELEITIPLGY